MRVYDISMAVKNDMKVYKNKEEKRPYIEIIKDYGSSDMFESKITLDMHTGTHMDAPLHVIKGGKSIDKVDLQSLITKCRVIDFTAVDDKICEVDLQNKDIREGDFILFKTKNSQNEEFNPKFIYLDKSGAKFLSELGIKGVGTDGLGIERGQENHETHKILLGNDIHIIEGLDLFEIVSGEYTLIALPIKIEGVEASPVRAVLVEDIE
jgi:arylformamidase